MTDQEPDVPPTAQPRRSRLWWKIAIAVVGVLAIVAGVIAAVTISTNAAAEEARATASRSSAEASASASAEASKKAAQAKADEDLDKSIKDLATAMAKSLEDAAKEDRTAMEEGGWTYVSDYLYYAAPKDDRYTCETRHMCAAIIVTSTKEPDGCLGGMGVSVSFLTSSGVSVYNSVRTTGALHSGEQAQLEFSDLSGKGSNFRVDSIRCY